MTNEVVQELKSYLKYKVYLAIMFTYDKEEQDRIVKHLSNKNNLKSYKDFIIPYAKKGFIDDYCKENMFIILSNLREENKDREIRELINEIYISVNSQSGKNAIDFYRREFYCRYNNREKNIDDLVVYNIENLREAILLDQDIIFSHLFIDEKRFNEEYIDKLAKNDYYFSSVGCILEEKTFLEEDIEFMTTIKKVIEKKLELTNNLYDKMRIKSLNRFMKREIKKLK